MLPSIETAHNVNGNRRKQMAAECGVTPSQLYNWFTGRQPVPIWKRQSVDRALGQDVDWSQYSVEQKAVTRPERRSERQQAKTAPKQAEIDPEAPTAKNEGFWSFLTEEENV